MITSSASKIWGKGSPSAAASMPFAELLFMAGLRRSEVSATALGPPSADSTDGDGVLVTVRRSKKNQEGEVKDVRFATDRVARATPYASGRHEPLAGRPSGAAVAGDGGAAVRRGGQRRRRRAPRVTAPGAGRAGVGVDEPGRVHYRLSCWPGTRRHRGAGAAASAPAAWRSIPNGVGVARRQPPAADRSVAERRCHPAPRSIRTRTSPSDRSHSKPSDRTSPAPDLSRSTAPAQQRTHRSRIMPNCRPFLRVS